MASSLTRSTLAVTISEVITLNDQLFNSENQALITDVYKIDERGMSLPTDSETTICLFATQDAAGTFVRDKTKYVRITNKDTVNYARIRVKKNGADAFDIRLDPSQSMMMGNAKLNVSETASSFVTFQDADTISGQGCGGAVDIDYFIAST
jgi:hypothetical protein